MDAPTSPSRGTSILRFGLLALLPVAGAAQGVDTHPPNAAHQSPALPGQTRAPERKSGVAFEVRTAAKGLERPWGLAFLPDGRILVTERPGRMRVVSGTGRLSSPVTGLPAVDARDKGGLLDVALDPSFATNRLVYWSYAEPGRGGVARTAVASGHLVDGATPRLEDVRVIFRQAPALRSADHFGARLVFARDGTLFVAMGDRYSDAGRRLTRQLGNHIGKIVRIKPDGSVPTDNPFIDIPEAKPEIWSIGHRNIQAAALHPITGELWEVEHGARGGDELNVVRKGRDYGWPAVAYGIEDSGAPIGRGLTAQEGVEQPVYYWDPVIAPSGMVFYTGSLFPEWRGSVFIGGLASKCLVRLQLEGETVVGEERLLTDLRPKRERIRDVRQGPDGALYLLTDDDQGRLLKLVPAPKSPAAAK